MTQMPPLPVSSSRKQRGATGLAYGLMVGLVAIVALGAITTTGDRTENLFTNVGGHLSNVTEGTSSPEQTATATPTPAFASHIFTTCGTTGTTGPSQSACRSEYDTDWDEDDAQFTVTGGIQSWTVPVTGTYRITARGARGGAGGNPGGGGAGALKQAEFALTAGEVLEIAVGQEGSGGNGNPSQNGNYDGGGGGGGSFVVASGNTPLVVAGGGGGAGYPGHAGLDGLNSLDGGDTLNNGGGTNGTGGDDGQNNGPGCGGAGFNSDGGESSNGPSTNCGGHSWGNGLAGGTASNNSSGYNGGNGGFGGGGGSWSNSAHRGGGGGGWSGGQGANGGNTGGGGGGSYAAPSGSAETGTTGENDGPGSVTITLLN